MSILWRDTYSGLKKENRNLEIGMLYGSIRKLRFPSLARIYIYIPGSLIMIFDCIFIE
jgi:hypothetical protein